MIVQDIQCTDPDIVIGQFLYVRFEIVIPVRSLVFKNLGVIHLDRMGEPFIKLAAILKVPAELRMYRASYHRIDVKQPVIHIIQDQSVTHVIGEVIQRPVSDPPARIIPRQIMNNREQYITEHALYPYRKLKHIREHFHYGYT